MRSIFFVLLISLVSGLFCGCGLMGGTEKSEQLQAENDRLKSRIADLEKVNLEVSRQRNEAMALMKKATNSLKELLEKINSMPEMKDAAKNWGVPPLPPLPDLGQ